MYGYSFGPVSQIPTRCRSPGAGLGSHPAMLRLVPIVLFQVEIPSSYSETLLVHSVFTCCPRLPRYKSVWNLPALRQPCFSEIRTYLSLILEFTLPKYSKRRVNVSHCQSLGKSQFTLPILIITDM